MKKSLVKSGLWVALVVMAFGVGCNTDIDLERKPKRTYQRKSVKKSKKSQTNWLDWKITHNEMPEPYMKNSQLTNRERELLKETMKTDNVGKSEIDEIKKQQKNATISNQESMWGKQPSFNSTNKSTK